MTIDSKTLEEMTRLCNWVSNTDNQIDKYRLGIILWSVKDEMLKELVAARTTKILEEDLTEVATRVSTGFFWAKEDRDRWIKQNVDLQLNKVRQRR